MDKLNWTIRCLDCGHTIRPEKRRLIAEGEAVLHKMRTGHRILLQGEVSKEVDGVKAVGKLI